MPQWQNLFMKSGTNHPGTFQQLPTPSVLIYHWSFFLKFWMKSVEFSFYLILFGKHTAILSNTQWNLGRFAVK